MNMYDADSGPRGTPLNGQTKIRCLLGSDTHNVFAQCSTRVKVGGRVTGQEEFCCILKWTERYVLAESMGRCSYLCCSNSIV